MAALQVTPTPLPSAAAAGRVCNAYSAAITDLCIACGHSTFVACGHSTARTWTRDVAARGYSSTVTDRCVHRSNRRRLRNSHGGGILVDTVCRVIVLGTDATTQHAGPAVARLCIGPERAARLAVAFLDGRSSPLGYGARVALTRQVAHGGLLLLDHASEAGLLQALLVAHAAALLMMSARVTVRAGEPIDLLPGDWVGAGVVSASTHSLAQTLHQAQVDRCQPPTPLRVGALVLDSLAANGAPAARATLSVISLAQHLVQPGLHCQLVLLSSALQLSAALTPAPASSSVGHSVMLGLGRVLRLEHAELGVRAASLARGAQLLAQCSRTLAEGSGGDAEHEPTWSRSARLVSSLRKVAAATPPPRQHGTRGGAYVITGGLGGLGLRAATLLGTRGGARPVLIARSAGVARDGQGLAAQLRSVRSGHTGAATVACNVAKRADALGTLQMLAGLRLGGVLHAAGLLRDALLRSVRAAQVAAVFASKATAACALHAMTAQRRAALALLSSVCLPCYRNAAQRLPPLS